MSQSGNPQEHMTFVTLDAEIVACEARIEELKARLKVLRKARKKMEATGPREDGLLGGRLEEDIEKKGGDPHLGGTLGQGSTL